MFESFQSLCFKEPDHVSPAFLFICKHICKHIPTEDIAGLQRDVINLAIDKSADLSFAEAFALGEAYGSGDFDIAIYALEAILDNS